MVTNPLAEKTLVLRARTAEELMSSNPLSIRSNATVGEAANFLVDRRISAAPVIDEAGRPIGVLSQTDLMIHQHELCGTPPAVDPSRADELMTPAIFSVGPHTTASRVLEEMLRLKVHRLFVVDKAGVLVGVISALDILRHLEDVED
jgi:CBS domain-containing protein